MLQNLYTHIEIQQQKLREESEREALLRKPGQRKASLSDQLRASTGDALISLGQRMKPKGFAAPQGALRKP
jgi:hypothetical protein